MGHWKGHLKQYLIIILRLSMFWNLTLEYVISFEKIKLLTFMWCKKTEQQSLNGDDDRC